MDPYVVLPLCSSALSFLFFVALLVGLLIPIEAVREIRIPLTHRIPRSRCVEAVEV